MRRRLDPLSFGPGSPSGGRVPKGFYVTHVFWAERMEATQELKRMAAGRWPEILRALGGLPSELLDGKNHPCPRCGGNDRFRYLQTDLDGNRKLLVVNQCFKAGRRNGDGLAALQWLTRLGLPRDKRRNSPSISASAWATAGGQAATAGGRAAVGKSSRPYDYRDESGTLLFQVCRIEPKDFRQRRPDGRGGWTWSVKGVRTSSLPVARAGGRAGAAGCGCRRGEGLRQPGPYRRRAGNVQRGRGREVERGTRKAPGRPAGGYFAGQRRTGQQHAQQVAASLYGLAESVRIVDLPGLSDPRATFPTGWRLVAQKRSWLPSCKAGPRTGNRRPSPGRNSSGSTNGACRGFPPTSCPRCCGSGLKPNRTQRRLPLTWPGCWLWLSVHR
jgi:hypothetical protein